MVGSSAFTARPAGDKQQVMLHSRPGRPELAWVPLLRQVALSGVESRSGWRRTLGESAAECGPGLCCPSRRSPWVSPSESGGSGQCPGQVEQSQWWLWRGAEPDLVSEPWLDHFPGAWSAHPHSGQEGAPCARHAAPQTENRDVGAALGRARVCLPGPPSERGSVCVLVSTRSPRTCASAYTTSLPSPFRSAHPSPIPVWSEPSWSVTTLCNMVATR